MTLEFKRNKSLVIGMDQYIYKIMQDFPECVTGTAPSPAADHLYQVRNATEACPLYEERALAFHHTMAQLLFASTRVR